MVSKTQTPTPTSTSDYSRPGHWTLHRRRRSACSQTLSAGARRLAAALRDPLAAEGRQFGPPHRIRRNSRPDRRRSRRPVLGRLRPPAGQVARLSAALVSRSPPSSSLCYLNSLVFMELNHVKMRNDDCLIRIEEVFVALVCYLSHSSGGRREPYALAVNWVLFHSSRWGVLCDENGWLRLKESTVQHSVRCGARAWSSWLLVLDMLMMIDGHDPPFRAWLDNFCGSSTLHPPLGASSSTLSWKWRKWNKGWCGDDGVGEDSIWKCVTKRA